MFWSNNIATFKHSRKSYNTLYVYFSVQYTVIVQTYGNSVADKKERCKENLSCKRWRKKNHSANIRIGEESWRRHSSSSSEDVLIKTNIFALVISSLYIEIYAKLPKNPWSQKLREVEILNWTIHCPWILVKPELNKNWTTSVHFIQFRLDRLKISPELPRKRTSRRDI